MLYFDRPKMAGKIPYFADENDPRPLVEQLNESYAHGGGWRSFTGFTLHKNGMGNYALTYPGDPQMREMARAPFRNQLVVLFESAWVGIIENDELVDVSRMD